MTAGSVIKTALVGAALGVLTKSIFLNIEGWIEWKLSSTYQCPFSPFKYKEKTEEFFKNIQKSFLKCLYGIFYHPPFPTLLHFWRQNGIIQNHKIIEIWNSAIFCFAFWGATYHI